MLLPVPKCSLSLCSVLRCMLTRCQLLISQQTTTFSVYPHRNKAGLRQSLHCVHTSRLKQTRLTAKQQHRRGDAKCIPSASSFMSLFDALLTCLGVNLNICCMWIALPCWWFRYRVFAKRHKKGSLPPPTPPKEHLRWYGCRFWCLPWRLCLSTCNFKDVARDCKRREWPTRLHLRHKTAALMLFNLVSLQRLLLRNQRVTCLTELPEKSKEL